MNDLSCVLFHFKNNFNISIYIYIYFKINNFKLILSLGGPFVRIVSSVLL